MTSWRFARGSDYFGGRSQTSLQPDFLGGVFWGFYRTPEDKRNWPAIRAALKRCAAHSQSSIACWRAGRIMIPFEELRGRLDY